MDCRVRIKVVDWQDRDFVAALDADLKTALLDGVDADCAAVADRVQSLLRSDGYPAARIDYSRSVADVLARVANWTVRRDAGAEARA
jgi:hypothetical protein